MNKLKQIIAEAFKSSLDEAWDPSTQLTDAERDMFQGAPNPFGSESDGAIGFDGKPNVMASASTEPSETEKAMAAAINAYAAGINDDFKGEEELKNEIMAWVKAFLKDDFKHPDQRPRWKYSGVKHRGARS